MRCEKCGRPATIFLHHSQQHLCKRCFKRQFEKKVRRANREYKLFHNNQKIVVAFSGGKDSTALLLVLKELSKNMKNFEIIPVFVDEGIKGYTDKELGQVKKTCKELNLNLKVYSFEKFLGASLDQILKRRDELGLSERACTICGTFRKRILNEAAAELGAKAIALGHTAEDMAETYLMNTLRNEYNQFLLFGVRSGIEEREGLVSRIRPLAFIYHEEAELYTQLFGAKYYAPQCPNRAEAFRGVARNFIINAEKKYPGTALKIIHYFSILRKELLKCKKEKVALKKCKICGYPTLSEICNFCKLKNKLEL